MFLEEMQDIYHINRSLYQKAQSACAEIQGLYKSLADKVYSLADCFKKIHANQAQLEKLSKESKMEMPKPLISDAYNLFKITLFAWSNQYKMNSEGMMKIVQPYCKFNVDKITEMNDVNLRWFLAFPVARDFAFKAYEGM